MIKLGKKSPYITTVPKSFKCGSCSQPSMATSINIAMGIIKSVKK